MNESSTEDKIKEAARNVFIRKGMTGARMQEIADEAGINKALLHYYYRNKDQLFNAVFEEILKGFIPRLLEVLNSEVPLEAKVYQVTDKYLEFLKKHRDLPLFVLNEIQQNPARLAEKMNINKGQFQVLHQQLQLEISEGTIRPVSMEMFVMNMLSLLVFPFICRQFFQQIMVMDDPEFDRFIADRKIEVPRFIMNALRP